MTLASPMVSRWVEDGLRDPEAFWARAARDVPWLRAWDRVFEWNAPTSRWFLGAETNLWYTALDYHVGRGWGGHAAHPVGGRV